jgi:CBS domain-containing protein
MMQKNIGALPVIEDTRLVGIVTEFDLVKAFAGE